MGAERAWCLLECNMYVMPYAPAPMIARDFAPTGESHFAASPVTAPVRIAVRREPSRMHNGCPVAEEQRYTREWISGRRALSSASPAVQDRPLRKINMEGKGEERKGKD
jgi:hypothetical protein